MKNGKIKKKSTHKTVYINRKWTRVRGITLNYDQQFPNTISCNLVWVILFYVLRCIALYVIKRFIINYFLYFDGWSKSNWFNHIKQYISTLRRSH